MKLISCLALSAILVCSCGKSGGSSSPNGSNNPNDPNNPDNPNVPTYTQMKQLSTGVNYACGIDLNSNVRCIGQNYYGQFGDGTINNASSTSANQNINNALSVASGGTSVCSLKKDNTVWCSGSNKYGELGSGTNVDSNTPVQVKNVSAQ